MDVDFENLIKETENRRKIAMQKFFAKYETHGEDSDEEVFDFKELRIIKPKKKKKKNLKAKKPKREPPKSVEFGEMNSYCISVETEKYIKKIKRHIRTVNQSNDDDSILSYEGEEYEETNTTKVTVTMKRSDDKSLCNENQDEISSLNCKSNWNNSITDSIPGCEGEEYKEAKTTKMIVKQNRINDAYHEKSDLSEDDKSDCNENQNETLPIISKSNLNYTQTDLQYPNNSKIDSLISDESKISWKGKYSFSSIREIYAYNQYFTSSPTLDPIRKGLNICPLTSFSKFEYQKLVGSSLKFSNNSSTPMLAGKKASKLKKCFVSLQRITLSKNAIAGSFKSPESRLDFKSPQNVSNSSQLKFIKNSLSVKPDYNCAQKLSQEKPKCKKRLLESFTPVSVQKRLRPRCPNSGLVTLKGCSCVQHAPQKENTSVFDKEHELQKTCNTTLLRNSNTYQKNNASLSEESSTENISHEAVNPNNRTSNNLSTDKSIIPKCLNSNLTTLENKCVVPMDKKKECAVQVDMKNECAIQVDKSAMYYSEYRFQNTCNITEAKTNNIVTSKDIYTPQGKNQLKPRKIFAFHRCATKKLDPQNKISDTHLTEKSSSSEADADLSSSGLKHTSVSSKDVSCLTGKDMNTPVICDKKIVSPEIQLQKCTSVPKEKASLLEGFDAENFSDNVYPSHKASKYVLMEKSNNEIPFKIKDCAVILNPVAENLQHNYVNLCNEISGKLSTVKSNDKIYCPKISSPGAISHSIRSETCYSNSRHASVEDSSGEKYPVLRSKRTISFSKNTFKISSNNESGTNRNSLLKDTSSPKIGKKQPKPKEASTPNICPVSAIGNNSLSKVFSTPRIVKKLRPKKISTPNSCPNLYMECRLSHSVKKSNLKYARYALYKFNKSLYHKKNGNIKNLSSSNDILGIKLTSSLKYERDIQCNSPKEEESMKPLPKRLKLTPNLSLDSLSML